MSLPPNNNIKYNIPRIIHNYELENEVCEIPCGNLYIAKNKYINEKVYIKIYNKYKLFISFRQTSFINNEIFILKLLNHRNILQLYEFIESDKFIFIIFEYFKGETMEKYFTKRKKINENLSLKIFYELIITMNYLHNMNICHLNLNFENILIDEKHNIKLINFDYSCFYKENIKKDIIQKNNIFSCPEIHGKQYFSPEKVDVYSCGIILYYFLMGYFPFNSDKKMVIEELIMKGKYSVPNGISKNIKNLINQMLEYKPEKRIKFKDIINCDWFKDNKNIINKSSVNQGINRVTQKYPIDNNILKICDNYKINTSELVEDIKNNKCNPNISTYKQLVSYLNSKNISTVNNYFSEKFKNYINKKDNNFMDNTQKENREKFMNEENEKNKIMQEIEDNFYSNGFKVLEALKQIKIKLEEQKLNNTKEKRKPNYHKKDDFSNLNKILGKNIKFNNLRRNNQASHGKKVTIKSEHNGQSSYAHSSKNLPRPKKRSVYVKRPKEKNDNFIPGRKRIFTVRGKKPNHIHFNNISNSLEKLNKDSIDNEYNRKKRGISLHVKLSDKSKNKISHSIIENKNKNKIDNNNIEKDDFEIPLRKRIYSTVNKKNKKGNLLGKNDNNIKNSFNTKIKNNEEPLMKIQRKRIYSTFIKKDKKDINNSHIINKFRIKEDGSSSHKKENPIINSSPKIESNKDKNKNESLENKIPISEVQEFSVKKEEEESNDHPKNEKYTEDNENNIYSDKEEINDKEHLKEDNIKNNENDLINNNVKKIIDFDSDNNDTLENKKEIENIQIDNNFNIYSDQENSNDNEQNKNKNNNKDNDIVAEEEAPIIEKDINSNKENNKELEHNENNKNEINKSYRSSSDSESSVDNNIIKNSPKMQNELEKEIIKPKQENNLVIQEKPKEEKNQVKETINNKDSKNIKQNKKIENKKKENKKTENTKIENKKIENKKKENKKKENKKKENKDDVNFDYLKSKIVPKKTRIDYVKSFGDIYEPRGKQEDNLKNNKPIEKEKINNDKINKVKQSSNTNVNNDNLKNNINNNNNDNNNNLKNNKKKVKFQDEEMNKEQNKSKTNMKINDIDSHYYDLIFSENKGKVTKNKNKKNLVLLSANINYSTNFNFNNVTSSTIKGSQTTSSKNSFDILDEYKSFLSNSNNKSKISLEENKDNYNTEREKRNSKIGFRPREEKAKIKKFVEKTDFNYLDYRKKPKNKIIYKNRTKSNKSKDISINTQENNYDYGSNNFTNNNSKEHKIKNLKVEENKKINKNNTEIKNNITEEEKYCYENEEFVFNFKTNKIIKKSEMKKKEKEKENKKTKIKIIKEKPNEKEKQKEKEKKNIKHKKNVSSSSSSSSNSSKNNSKSKTNVNNNRIIRFKYDKYKFVTNRNIIDILSSKQSSKKFDLNLSKDQPSKKEISNNNNENDNAKEEDNAINKQSDKNLYETFNSVSAFTLSNTKGIKNINTQSNTSLNNTNNNKQIKSINSYNFIVKNKNSKNFQKRWERNILNLTTKENNESNNKTNEHKKLNNSKFFFDDSFFENIIKNHEYEKGYNTTYNSGTISTKNLSNKSKHIKLNSSEILLNKIKNKNNNSQLIKIKKNKNNSMEELKPNLNKKYRYKTNNASSSVLKKNKSSKIQKEKKNSNKEKIKNYFGPIDVGLISLKNFEESIDDIINKMSIKGFECQKVKYNLIKCNKDGKLIEIKLVKLKGNLIYYLTKKIH